MRQRTRSRGARVAQLGAFAAVFALGIAVPTLAGNALADQPADTTTTSPTDVTPPPTTSPAPKPDPAPKTTSTKTTTTTTTKTTTTKKAATPPPKPAPKPAPAPAPAPVTTVATTTPIVSTPPPAPKPKTAKHVHRRPRLVQKKPAPKPKPTPRPAPKPAPKPALTHATPVAAVARAIDPSGGSLSLRHTFEIALISLSALFILVSFVPAKAVPRGMALEWKAWRSPLALLGVSLLLVQALVYLALK